MKKIVSPISSPKEWILLSFLFLFALTLRTMFLDRIPNAIGGDELVYVMTAKAIALTGSDLTGTWNPLSAFTFHYPPGESQAELPYFLFIPFIGFTHFSLFTARITNAILSALTVIVLYGIAKKLFDKKTAIITALIASINPWLLYTGRTAYEVVPATFFYCLGFLILLTQKKRRLLFAIPVFFAAFYSYIGTKVVFLPFIVVTSFFSWFVLRKKKDTKFFLVIILSTLLLLGIYASALFHGTTTRFENIYLPTNPTITSQVDGIRKDTISSCVLPLFDNKYSIYIKNLVHKLFDTISANYLFASGDTFFSIYSHGLMYPIDALFITVGIGSVFFISTTLFLLITCLFLIALLPQVLFDSSNLFAPHITMVFPMLLLLIGIGVKSIADRIPKKFTVIFLTILAIVYSIACLNFFYIFMFQHSLKGHFDFPVRVLSRYINLARSSSGEIYVYTTQQSDKFKKYVFYSDTYSRVSAPIVRNAFEKNSFTLDTVHFLSCDDTINPGLFPNSVIVKDVACNAMVGNEPFTSIKQLNDAGDVFTIYNDRLCETTWLKPYPDGITLADFLIERMDREQFCRTYIFRR